MAAGRGPTASLTVITPDDPTAVAELGLVALPVSSRLFVGHRVPYSPLVLPGCCAPALTRDTNLGGFLFRLVRTCCFSPRPTCIHEDLLSRTTCGRTTSRRAIRPDGALYHRSASILRKWKT